MGHLTYFALLVGCLVVTAPLELLLGVRVHARWRRLLLALEAVRKVTGWDVGYPAEEADAPVSARWRTRRSRWSCWWSTWWCCAPCW